MVIRLFTLLFIAASLLVSAWNLAPQQQPNVVLEGSVVVSVGEVTVDEEVPLLLYLQPAPGSEVVITAIEAADQTTWELHQPSLRFPLTLSGPDALPITVTAKRAAKSQPVILVAYQVGNAPGKLPVTGEWVQVLPKVAPPAPLIPTEATMTFIVGALTAIFTIGITEIVSHLRQTAKNRERVCGLLTFLCAEAEDAAINRKPLDSAPIQLIYQSEGLYNILKENQLNPSVFELWKKLEQHNQEVNRQDSLQTDSLHAAAELSRAAKELLRKLSCFERKKFQLRAPGSSTSQG